MIVINSLGVRTSFAFDFNDDDDNDDNNGGGGSDDDCKRVMIVLKWSFSTIEQLTKSGTSSIPQHWLKPLLEVRAAMYTALPVPLPRSMNTRSLSLSLSLLLL